MLVTTPLVKGLTAWFPIILLTPRFIYKFPPNIMSTRLFGSSCSFHSCLVSADCNLYRPWTRLSVGMELFNKQKFVVAQREFQKFWKAQRHSPSKQGEMQLFILPDALWNYSIETLNIWCSISWMSIRESSLRWSELSSWKLVFQAEEIQKKQLRLFRNSIKWSYSGTKGWSEF